MTNWNCWDENWNITCLPSMLFLRCKTCHALSRLKLTILLCILGSKKVFLGAWVICEECYHCVNKLHFTDDLVDKAVYHLRDLHGNRIIINAVIWPLQHIWNNFCSYKIATFLEWWAHLKLRLVKTARLFYKSCLK